jgi:predicted hydrocarbon binding protein
MSVNRKEFIQKACIAGACICGFGSIAIANEVSNSNIPSNTLQDTNPTLQQEWIANRLKNIDSELKPEQVRKIVKSMATVHYTSLKMDEMLSKYIGDIEGFIQFISEKWGWKVNYDKDTKTIIADENKSYCVCPMVNQKAEIRPSLICYCSEGFAEKMFSTVNGSPVKATVISSIIRGDKCCKYKIELVQ